MCSSDALVDEVAIGRRSQMDADPEQCVEGTVHVSPPVPTEHEFIEVALQVALSEAVEHALRPSLQVGEHTMHPTQDLVRACAGDDLGLAGVCGRVLIAKPAVRDEMRAGFDGPADEAVQRFRRPVGDGFHADTSRLPVGGQFHRTDHEHLADRAAPSLRLVARVVPRPERHLRFINFHKAFQRVAVRNTHRIDHGAAELVQQQPCRLVAAQAELGLELQRRHAVRVTGHDVCREKPRPKRQVAGMHHRAGHHRGLVSAAGTFPSGPPALQRPAFAGAARGAHEALRPTPFRKISRAPVLIGEARVERLAGHGSVGFPTGWHERNNTRTLAQRKTSSSTSCGAGMKGISLAEPI